MSHSEFETVRLQDDFYRDSIGKVILCYIGVLIGIVILLMLSLYLHYTKPQPTTFFVDREWRVQSDVPLNLPYLSAPDMLQWVAEFLPQSFIVDFNHYHDQVQSRREFFTDNGWPIFTNQLNNYASYDNVIMNKLFVTATPIGAPYILNQGILGDRYAWWVKMPLRLNFTSAGPGNTRVLNLQILVVRVPTLNNLNGIAMDNIIVESSTA